MSPAPRPALLLMLALLITLATLSAPPAARASPLSEIEPNNSTGQSQALSTIGVYSPINGSIGAAADQDYYSFDAVAGRTYTVELYNVASALGGEGQRCTDPGMYFGEKGLALFVLSQAQAVVAGQCDASARSAGNTHHSVSFTAAESGPFLIRVLANSYTATGFYSLRVMAKEGEPGGEQWDVSFEPNTTTRLAYPITPGYSHALTSGIETRDPRYATYAPDQDWYRLDAQAGRTYVIEVFDVAQALGAAGSICSAPFDFPAPGLFLVVLDPSAQNEVLKQCGADANHASGTVHHFAEFTAAVSGPHYILVKPNLATASGFYSIRVLPKYGQTGAAWDPTSHEPNNALPNAYQLGLGETTAGQIDLRDPTYSTFFADSDWYRFAATAGRSYEVMLYNVIGSLAGGTCLSIHDAARAQLAGGCAGGPGGPNTIHRRVQFTAPLDGTYFFRLTASSAEATGSYKAMVCEGTCTRRDEPSAPPWQVLLYLAGDDNSTGVPGLGQLSRAIVELRAALGAMPYNPDMRLLVLFDGGASGDTAIYERRPEGLVNVTEAALASPAWLGAVSGGPGSRELDSGSKATLSSFVNWARRDYPGSTHTMLAIVDHGGGWAPTLGQPGQPSGRGLILAGGWRGTSLDLSTSGVSSLSTRELGEALRDAGHLDVLFLDACLMAMLENAHELRDHVDYLVAGENLLFARLPYNDYLAPGGLTGATTPEGLAQRIVARYNAGVNSEQFPYAISALDLRQLRSVVPGNLSQRVNLLAGRLLAALPDPVPAEHPLLLALQQVYTQTQKFDYDSSLTLDPREGYVDLIDFATSLHAWPTDAVPPDVKEAADELVSAARQVVVDSRAHSGHYGDAYWDLSGASGISIFLPLGERDHRPTHINPLSPGQPATPERQLGYYDDVTQLAFRRDVPAWAGLLLRLEPTVAITRTGDEGLAAASLAAGTDGRPFHTPTQLIPRRRVALPAVGR